MGFEIAVGFPSVYAVSFFAVERNIVSIFHESFLNTAEKLLDYLDDLDQDYLIKAKFKGLRLLLETKQWTRIKANHDWESTEFTHQCGTWSRSRKFVAVRREKEIDGKDTDTLFEIKEYDYFCFILTMSNKFLFFIFFINKIKKRNWFI